MEKYNSIPFKAMNIDGERFQPHFIMGRNGRLICKLDNKGEQSLKDVNYILEACNNYHNAIEVLAVIQKTFSPESMYYKFIDTVLKY